MVRYTTRRIDRFAVRPLDQRSARLDIAIQIGLFVLMATFAGLFGWAFHMWKTEENICKGKRLRTDGPFDATKHCLAWHMDGLRAREEGSCMNPCDKKLYAQHTSTQSRRRLQLTCASACARNNNACYPGTCEETLMKVAHLELCSMTIEAFSHAHCSDYYSTKAPGKFNGCAMAYYVVGCVAGVKTDATGG